MNSPIHLHQDTRTAAFAEGRLRNWVKVQESAPPSAPDRPASSGLSFVAISREAGAGADTVATLLGERLGWPVFGRNLLDRIAQRYNVPRLMLDLVDETESNWVYDVLGTWMDRQVIPHEKFVAQLSRLIRLIARSGNALFVGRGMQFLLPKSKTFAVRVVASEAFRAERVRRRKNVSMAEALHWIHRTDRGRREFVSRFFRRDVNDPHLYDMVVNVERVGPHGAAEQIARAVQAAPACVAAT